MAVINRGDMDGTIPKDTLDTFKAGLARFCNLIFAENQCRVKLRAFGDLGSVELHKAAVKKLGEIWPITNLDVMSNHNMPSRLGAHAWIPVYPDSTDEGSRMLKDNYPDFPTHNWKLGRFPFS